MPHAPRIMLFDLYHGGHHGQHIRVLVDYWRRRGLPGQLDIVVAQEFAARFPVVLEAGRAASNVAFHPTEEAVGLHAKQGRLAVLQNDRRMGQLLRRAVERHRPDHCVLMHFDHLQVSLATGLRFGFPVRFSGTYFRPSFYYRRTGAGPSTFKTVLDDLQKRTLLQRALRNPHFDTLFTLDLYAVAPIQRLGTPARVVHLPEPLEADPPEEETPQETRQRLGVEGERQVLLLFGSLDPRKGVLELLRALSQLPDELARRACLVIAGETTTIRREMLETMEMLRRRGALQVVHRDAFVSDAEMHALFRAASLVLAPYQYHVGSSGVLVRTAAAGVPVLGPRYGMLGRLIEDRRLGLSVDTTDPADLIRGLSRFLDPDVLFPFNANAARAFAAENTEETMASTIFDHVLRGA